MIRKVFYIPVKDLIGNTVKFLKVYEDSALYSMLLIDGKLPDYCQVDEHTTAWQQFPTPNIEKIERIEVLQSPRGYKITSVADSIEEFNEQMKFYNDKRNA